MIKIKRAKALVFSLKRKPIERSREENKEKFKLIKQSTKPRDILSTVRLMKLIDLSMIK